VRVDAGPDAPPPPCTISPNIRLSNAAGVSNRVALTSNGSGLAVVWNDNRDGNNEIYFEALDATGAPTTAELRVTNTATPSTWPSVGWSGASYGVMWAEGGGPSTMMFQELDATGAPIGGGQTLVTLDSSFVPARWQHWGGGAYTVMWQQDPGTGDHIYFMQLDEAGNVVTPAVQVTQSAGMSGFPQGAPNGNGYGVAWNDGRDGNAEIYFAALDASGNKLGSDVRLTNTSGTSLAPAIDWTGTTYGVTWWDSTSGTAEQYFAILDDTGAPLGPQLEVTPGQYSQLAITKWSGKDFGISWFDFRNGILEPYFARLDRNGMKVGDDLRVSTGGVDCNLEAFDVARTANGYAIAWADNRTSDTEVYLALASCP
jgi:hypothetical protein